MAERPLSAIEAGSPARAGVAPAASSSERTAPGRRTMAKDTRGRRPRPHPYRSFGGWGSIGARPASRELLRAPEPGAAVDLEGLAGGRQLDGLAEVGRRENTIGLPSLPAGGQVLEALALEHHDARLGRREHGVDVHEPLLMELTKHDKLAGPVVAGEAPEPAELAPFVLLL